eukprot:3645789-Pleurochrysis_carterae.AAC.4
MRSACATSPATAQAFSKHVYEITSGSMPAAAISVKAPSALGTSPTLAHALISALKAARSGTTPEARISPKILKTRSSSGGAGVVLDDKKGCTTGASGGAEAESDGDGDGGGDDVGRCADCVSSKSPVVWALRIASVSVSFGCVAIWASVACDLGPTAFSNSAYEMAEMCICCCWTTTVAAAARVSAAAQAAGSRAAVEMCARTPREPPQALWHLPPLPPSRAFEGLAERRRRSQQRATRPAMHPRGAVAARRAACRVQRDPVDAPVAAAAMALAKRQAQTRTVLLETRLAQGCRPSRDGTVYPHAYLQ